MALRMIEMVLPQREGEEVRALLKDRKMLEHRQVRLGDGEVMVRLLMDAEQSEAVLDLLGQRYAGANGTRVVILPVEATLPRAEPAPSAAPDGPGPDEAPAQEDKTLERISREELYEDIKDAARCSHVYLAMAALATVVASVGLEYDSVAVIIGAMVVAPLLGPNMAMALGTALGDLPLVKRAVLTGLAGMATVAVLSVIIGAVVRVDPALKEVATRTSVGLGDVAVALASGCAGALAFTTGVSATLIGVMVAVALLPPLVACGLLLGGGHPASALGAFSLFLMNLICINLAGVTTFIVQGIRPVTWFEKGRATRATRVAIGMWVVLLAALIGTILLLRKAQP